jgi:hypothetical protein
MKQGPSILTSNFDLAKQITESASAIDDLQSVCFLAPETHEQIKAHIDKLHDISEKLAGARMNELYDQSEGSEKEEETHL